MSADSPDSGLSEADEDRWVGRRRQILRRRDGLGTRIATAIAWHELGYTSAGVAKQIGSTAGTVQGYFDHVADEHGPAAAVIKRESELGVHSPLRAPSMAGGDE